VHIHFMVLLPKWNDIAAYAVVRNCSKQIAKHVI